MVSKKKRRLKKRVIIIPLILIILGIIGYTGYGVYNEAMDMKSKASIMKSQLKTVVTQIKDQDGEGASATMEEVMSINQELKDTLDSPLWTMARSFGEAGENLTSIRALLDVVDEANEGIIQPFILQGTNYPLDQLKVGEGSFNVTLINSYVDFFTEIMPDIKDMSEKMTEVTNLSLVDKDGQIMSIRDSLVSLNEHYDQIETYIPLLRSVLGDGTDRLYMILAQNSSEIRAGGGFPGSIGTLRIENGILSIGDFDAVGNTISFAQPYAITITDTEYQMFGGVYFTRSTGATYDPDFRRQGEILAAAYDQANGTNIDGVISMTPHIIQHLLAMTGEITLSDGTVVNGDNATKVLMHDLYYKYIGAGMNSGEGNAYTDTLFEETASAAMKSFVSAFSVSNLENFIDMFVECSQDRIIMVYFKDEAAENIAIQAGFAGVLNPGYNTNEAGVFYTVIDACKKGWFVDVLPEVTNKTNNEDGTTTYDVTVTLNNVITQDEIDQGSTYILGIGPQLPSFIHLSAPVGGTISNISTSNGMGMTIGEYEGVQIAYALYFTIYPNSPITITYQITTASDVSEDLVIRQTPTLTDYR